MSSPTGPREASWERHLEDFPPFARELASTLAVQSQYVLYGNVRDLYLLPDRSGNSLTTGANKHLGSLVDVLWAALRPNGYHGLIRFDAVHGMSWYPGAYGAHHPDHRDAPAWATEAVGGPKAFRRVPSMEQLRHYLARITGADEPPGEDADQAQTGSGPHRSPGARRPRVAVVIEYAARLITRDANSLSGPERDFFLFCQKLADHSRPVVEAASERAFPLYNPIVWLIEGERDLPAWFMAGSDRIRTIGIPRPDEAQRNDAARLQARQFGIESIPERSDLERQVQSFVRATDGETLRAMNEIRQLAMDRGLGFKQLDDASRMYRLGLADNPWENSQLRRRIIEEGPSLGARVRGQEQAVEQTLDVLKRAVLGLSGAHLSRAGTRPRGVLFFAGPTGTGKTELAKQISGMLFGDVGGFLRFDMSEFSAEHAADRLIGAPPGFVGYEAGGELTGAVRQNPYQVVLFDEIEKAHGRILDKFLQIIDDGRLTDGQGKTTYFSECVLVFTSNLGIRNPKAQPEEDDEIKPDDFKPEDWAKYEDAVLTGVRAYFTDVLRRPELLNRFGGNIVVFDFIQPDVASGIFGGLLATMTSRLAEERQLDLRVEPLAREELRRLCTDDLRNGGRGIGNELETHLINPLSRYLFDRGVGPGSTVTVQAVHPPVTDATGRSRTTTLTCVHSPAREVR